jgi:hypothetical protein
MQPLSHYKLVECCVISDLLLSKLLMLSLPYSLKPGWGGLYTELLVGILLFRLTIGDVSVWLTKVGVASRCITSRQSANILG